MRIIARSSLREFWERHPDIKAALLAWYADARQANWKSPEDVKEFHRNASIVSGNRVVFNIKGNQYRLIVDINYKTAIIYVRFIGSHQDYDKVDAATI